MSMLEDTVRAIVQDFMKNDILFTALDISNVVKQTMPQTRHREVRDVVRALFVSDIEPQGWARSPIVVNKADGTTVDALLYHPLADYWDLDTKYDNQRRSLTSNRPSQVAQAQAAQAVQTVAAVTPAPAQSQPATPVTPLPTARTLWDNLFQTQPSLFPSK